MKAAGVFRNTKKITNSKVDKSVFINFQSSRSLKLGFQKGVKTSVRGCPHYASRRRASRRGPSGVVCLDTWAMRRDYSRLQA